MSTCFLPRVRYVDSEEKQPRKSRNILKITVIWHVMGKVSPINIKTCYKVSKSVAQMYNLQMDTGTEQKV